MAHQCFAEWPIVARPRRLHLLFMSNPSFLVTGASGKLGRRVLEILLEREVGPLVATTRDPAQLADLAARGVDVRRADFDDPSTLPAAFAGAKRLLLVSTDSLDRPGRRVAQHTAAIRAAEAAGVEHVLYTSLTDAPTIPVGLAPDHAKTEAALAASRPDHTVLRNNMYTDMFDFSLPHAVASGQIVDSRADGKVAFVTREDCAQVAAAVLADTAWTGRHILDVAGTDAVSSAEVAVLLSELAKKPIRHVSVPVTQLIQGFVAHGMPAPVAEIYASFDTATAAGALGRVSDVVPRLVGRPAQSVRDWLAGRPWARPA
jgi:NAD(P)H dehydrogenase (quinone)